MELKRQRISQLSHAKAEATAGNGSPAPLGRSNI